jgi:hypothetical protein
MFNKFIPAVFLAVATFITPAKASLINVDLELQLLVDVSGSINSQEYMQQTQGYVDAFRSQPVIDAMLAGSNNSVAVQYIEWSGFSEQKVQVDWFFIDSFQAANSFADLILELNTDLTRRAFGLPDQDGIRRGATAIGRAIRFGLGEFDNDFASDVQVIDVSGDGISNSGSGNNSTPDSQRDYALANGIDQINAIAVGNDDVKTHYKDNVIGGKDSFLMSIDDMSQFSQGIEKKLLKEISNAKTVKIPEPTILALFSIAFLAAISRRHKYNKSTTS